MTKKKTVSDASNRSKRWSISGRTWGRPGDRTSRPASSGRPFPRRLKVHPASRSLFLQMGDRRAERPLDRVGLLPAFLPGAVALVILYNSPASPRSASTNCVTRSLPASASSGAPARLPHLRPYPPLSLRFHLERKTGGLSRIIERGTKGIETIVRFTILNSVPTLLEFLLTAVIFLVGLRLLVFAVTAITVWAYSGSPSRRATGAIGIRRVDERQRHGGQYQGDRLAPQLRDRQVFRQRGDGSQALRQVDGRYEKAATEVWTSARLAELRPDGDLRLGHDRHDGGCRHLPSSVASRRSATSSSSTPCWLQLAMPLNSSASSTANPPGLTDIEQMFDLLEVEPEVTDKPGAPTSPSQRAPSASRTCTSPTTRNGRS